MPLVIANFFDTATADIFNGNDTKAARSIPKAIWPIVIRKLDLLNAATNLLDLRVPPNNRLEALKGNMKGKHSIRVNDQYRIVFTWQNGTASDVRVTDYH
jgi:proteic killer suppression protein